MTDIWITKYALTDGIKFGAGYEIDRDGWAQSKTLPSSNGYWLISKSNFHDTLDAAYTAAEKMRMKKIASLKKQIAKLEAIDFKIAEVPE